MTLLSFFFLTTCWDLASIKHSIPDSPLILTYENEERKGNNDIPRSDSIEHWIPHFWSHLTCTIYISNALIVKSEWGDMTWCLIQCSFFTFRPTFFNKAATETEQTAAIQHFVHSYVLWEQPGYSKKGFKISAVVCKDNTKTFKWNCWVVIELSLTVPEGLIGDEARVGGVTEGHKLPDLTLHALRNGTQFAEDVACVGSGKLLKTQKHALQPGIAFSGTAGKHDCLR